MIDCTRPCPRGRARAGSSAGRVRPRGCESWNHSSKVRAMQLRAPEPSDAPAVLDLIVARDIADLGKPDYTLEDVQADWAAPGVDRARDAWLVEDGGAPLGYALLDDRGAALVTVPPASEGRGVGTALREAAERARCERGEALVRQYVPTVQRGRAHAPARAPATGPPSATSACAWTWPPRRAPPADVPVRAVQPRPRRRAGARARRGGDGGRARQRAALARVLAGREGRQGGLGPVALAAARGRRRARRRRAVRALGGRRRLRRLPRGRRPRARPRPRPRAAAARPRGAARRRAERSPSSPCRARTRARPGSTSRSGCARSGRSSAGRSRSARPSRRRTGPPRRRWRG